MNKLFGFFELKEVPIPSIDWKEFKSGTVLDDSKLWTIRTAKVSGSDTSLPRMVGKSAKECMEFAENLLKRYGNNLFVVYYPFFGAVKSGTMLVGKDSTTIEATNEDLWNLVDHHIIDLSARVSSSGKIRVGVGDSSFFTEDEWRKLIRCSEKVRTYFNKAIRANELVLLEWSFAKDTDVVGNNVGEEYLVFYEAKTVQDNPLNVLY